MKNDFLEWRKMCAPRLRRTGPTAIIHSGDKQTIFGCLCGAQHTCATNYRQAHHVADWRDYHDNHCWPVMPDAIDSNDEH